MNRQYQFSPKFQMMPASNTLILYCRPGFEKECGAEIIHKAAQKGYTGFIHTLPKSGIVQFTCHEPVNIEQIMQEVPFQSLIFARQFFALFAQITDLPAMDRISKLQEALGDTRGYGTVRVESADSEEGRTLAAFCRKFTVPLRQKLREQRIITPTENRTKPVLHVFFTHSKEACLGYSYPENNSPFLRGIPRLKFSAEAPSRSTLKLEEAFHLFIPYEEWQERLAAGMLAVDLGASPGGWTYQLVRRKMIISAVDNGPMDPALMATGQVKHFRQDGFKFKPMRKPVHWLVCDMVEKPSRVTALMATWLINGWCREAIFNLKLPMKKRNESIEQNLQTLQYALLKQSICAIIQAKQLYHDREEVTVHVQRVGGTIPSQK